MQITRAMILTVLSASASLCSAGIQEWSGRDLGTEWDFAGNDIVILAPAPSSSSP